ncbi:hypothetical protein J2Z75_005039 [Rhizobium herbae]|uniref:Uncharacterized protein n=1 Tax=Rhizobium herbae TaxID=508661 RepID=A0ABS4EU80_9HYPH|nr:hypothetical protein [Rhizobium herbae]
MKKLGKGTIEANGVEFLTVAWQLSFYTGK